MKLPFEFRSRAALACASLFLTLLPQAMVADDWPLVRGDTLGTGVAQTTLPDQPEVLWKYQASKDAGFDATPVVVDGVVYIGDSSGTFHAVHLADGSAVWTKEFADSGFAAGATVAKDRIYVGDLNGVVRCLSTTDGHEQWSAKLDGEIYAGPVLHGENLLVTSESGTLSCLSAEDGHEVWPPFKIDAPLRCSPTISAGRVMLAGCDSLLHVINTADGKEIHTVEIDGPTGATPAIRNERVYFGTEGGTFFAIDVPESSEPPSVAWTFRDPRRGQPIRSAAAVSNEIVVFGTQGKTIYGLNPENGDVKWNLPTQSRVESSAVIAGHRVVAATTAGKIYLLDAATGEAKWEYDAGGGFTASPAVVNARIILPNTDGTLYCFGRKRRPPNATE